MQAYVEPKIWLLRLFAASWTAISLSFALLVWFLWPTSPFLLLFLVAAVMFARGLIWPRSMIGHYRWVERLFSPIGWIVAFFLLALVYFTVFTLYSGLLRIARWDRLRLRNHEVVSGWVTRPRKTNSDSDYRWQY